MHCCRTQSKQTLSQVSEMTSCSVFLGKKIFNAKTMEGFFCSVAATPVPCIVIGALVFSEPDVGVNKLRKVTQSKS